MNQMPLGVPIIKRVAVLVVELLKTSRIEKIGRVMTNPFYQSITYTKNLFKLAYNFEEFK